MKQIRIVVAVVAALFFLLGASSALGQAPTFYSSPSIDIVVGQDHVRTPPAIPKVGDTLWGNNGSPVCDPSCDPNKPSQLSPGAVIVGGSPPVGQFYSWYRCNGDGCFLVQPRSTTVNTYVLKPEDAGAKLQFVVSLTNLDCGEVVRQGSNAGYQECRYTTTNATALTETVLPNVTVAIAPDTLPTASVGQIYYIPLTASNGTGPYLFSVTSGSMPPGLSLSPSGVVNGTATKPGSWTFSVRAAGSGITPGTRTYTLKVGLGLGSVADGTTGVAYTQALSAAGASGGVTYTVTDGALPDGLAVNGGQITGTPTKQGTFTFTLQGTDASGATGSKQYTMTINFPTLTISPTALDKAVRGVSFSSAIAASGGTAPYAYTLTAGRLPLGLSLRANGTIIGTPRATEPDAYEFTITVHDKYGAPGSVTYTLDYLAPNILVTPSAPANVAVGQKVHLKLKASGGTGPYTFVQRTGRLPDGLVLRPTGLIAGKPTTAGTFRFGVRVTDSDGAFTTVRLTIVVKSAPPR